MMKNDRTYKRTGGWFWRGFDRWALLAIIVLQGIFIALRRDNRAGQEAAPEPDCIRSVHSSPAGRSPVAAQPTAFGGLPHRRPISVESAIRDKSWGLLRRSPGLDVREHVAEYELRLSVPPHCEKEARAYVVGRRVDIEVPVKGTDGNPAERLYCQVLLPQFPHNERPARIEHTNGILRVFVAKPGTE